MESKPAGVLSLISYVAAGVLVVRLAILSPSHLTTSTLFRRSYFLIDILLGCAILLQAASGSSEKMGRLRKIMLASGIFILILGAGMGYSWIAGK